MSFDWTNDIGKDVHLKMTLNNLEIIDKSIARELSLTEMHCFPFCQSMRAEVQTGSLYPHEDEKNSEMGQA